MRLHTRVRRVLAASALTMAGVMGLAGTAWAAPANDDRANAEVLSLGLTASGTTVGATLEAGETAVNCFPGGDGGTTVWYSVTTSASDMDLQLVLSSATDQGLALWDSSGTTMIDCRDSQPGGQDEVLTVTSVTPSTTYLVSVDRFMLGDEGPFQLTATETAPLAPGGPVASSPPTLDYGQVPVGTESPQQQFTLTNGGQSDVEVVVVGLTGDQAEFPYHGTDCGTGTTGFIVPTTGCSFTFSYLPADAGLSMYEITWEYQSPEGPQQFTTTLTGEGVDEQPAPEVPEVPMTLLLPGSTLLLGAGVYLVRRRSRTAALVEG